ncbi:dGTPase [Roseimicrobium gellanilyticum]|uniref:dGTPase n=1 Tax=Roseimicrobium gellanilyticum TaxID=748857 RepID=A0A366H8D3_9BACT|nr:dNTP triphosphohydrolase [Roseimicrobium gellanilyticum]RBP37294.1 dGTPase [Roseimicrobium gellanilyticum]
MSFYSSFDTATVSSRSAHPDDHRTPFQIDRDRILHSAALRRLQGKTQVFYSFLVGEYDFYRTRLTHSLEVAQVGRSICAWLQKSSDLLQGSDGIDTDLVEATCLAHDLGHPPFGHTGERALHHLMMPYGGFEGNAQTLRLLTRTIFGEGREGMDPTRALLDGVMKYKTLYQEVPDAKNHYLYDEQSEALDFVHGDQPFPVELSPGKERNSFRSLECQIMDWADDTAYSINDLSDAIQRGFITASKLEAWAGASKLDDVEAGQVEFLLKAIREGKVEGRLGRGIGEHIRACSLEIRGNFMSELSRRYRYELVVDPAMEKRARLNKRIAMDLVFETPQLHQLDYKAESVLKRLFEVLEERYIKRDGSRAWHFLPQTVEVALDREDDEKVRARLVCDWIASLTDRNAYRVHQRLFDVGAGMGEFL